MIDPRRQVVDARLQRLRRALPLDVSDLAERFAETYESRKKLLRDLSALGAVRDAYGTWALPPKG